ncbi:MAG TPA: adenylate/guanylate cyclase domain-containing protein [Candidatus Nitrosotenuis sp.]|nr:adenylate/guanylate cyclase domain-containing protein [Candidatus Nitrosotenuis sp.]
MRCPACAFESPSGFKFCGQCATPLTAPEPQKSPAERRQLTVVFCDLAGSTELSETLDPEDLREVIRHYQRICVEVGERFAGHVAQYLGDGVLLYFGWPKAYEDSARRAVRAAFHIASGVEAAGDELQARYGVRPQVRVGVHTGTVVIGEMGSGERRERMALGDTPNIAARLQSVAEPGTVVISADTQRLMRHRFLMRDLGPQSLKGLSRPVSAFQVLGEVSARGQAALRLQALTPIHGRDDELRFLLEEWKQACEGAGRLVLVRAEGGLGKSRLLDELRARASAWRAFRLSVTGSRFHGHTPFHPVVEALAEQLRLDRLPDAEARLRAVEKMVDLLAPGPRREQAVPLLAELLGVPPGPYTLPALTPGALRQRTMQLLVQMLLGLSRRRPVLLLVEDAHHLDPSSLELLERVLEELPQAAVYVVLAARPEGPPPHWLSLPQVRLLELDRLEAEPVRRLVWTLAGGRALPRPVVEQIVLRADGVPLYVEELTRMVLESGLLAPSGGRFVLLRPLTSTSIPATLYDSLLARLDRLGPAKEVAQMAATIGRRFEMVLLGALCGLEAGPLQAEVERLTRADVVLPLGYDEYSFRHALLQEAAYQSLLKSTRQRCHETIARLLEERFPDTAPELLAHHYSEAQLPLRALGFWEKAGRAALEHSANVEAVHHFSRALELLPQLAESPRRLQRELSLQLALAPALIATRGYAAPEVARAYGRARDLCAALGDPVELYPALGGLWVFYLVSGELGRADLLSRRLQEMASAQGDSSLLLVAEAARGQTCFYQGRFPEAREHFEKAVALHQPRAHRSLALVYFLTHPAVGSLSYLALTLLLQGQPEEAAERARQALTLARDLGHAHTLAHTLFFESWLRLTMDDPAGALEAAREQIALAEEQVFPFFEGTGRVLAGWALLGLGMDGGPEIQAGLQLLATLGARLGATCFLYLTARLQALGGQPGAALATVEQGLGLATTAGERWWEPELHRLRGDLLAGGPEQRACYRRAREVALELGAPGLAARAEASLAALA